MDTPSIFAVVPVGQSFALDDCSEPPKIKNDTVSELLSVLPSVARATVVAAEHIDRPENMNEFAIWDRDVLNGKARALYQEEWLRKRLELHRRHDRIPHPFFRG